MEKTIFSSMTKAKKILALLLAVVLVLAMPGSAWAGPGDGGSSGPGGGGSSGPGGGSGGGDSSYEYSVRPGSASYSFNYQDCVYNQNTHSGNVAIVTANITGPLADDKTVGYNYSGNDMKWSIADIDTGANNTIVTFRGETNTSQDNVLDETSGVLTVEVLDKTYNGQGEKVVYGLGTINISFSNSLASHTITLDGNGGKLEVAGEGGNVSTVDTYDVTVSGGGSFASGLFDSITPVYEDGSKVFTGWKRDGDNNLYHNIATSTPVQKSIYSLTFNDDTTVKAIWQDAIEVKYVTEKGKISTAQYANGGDAKIEGNTATFYAPSGEKTYFIVEAEDEDDDEYIFSGWESSGGTEYGVSGTQGLSYTAAETYTAIWKKPISFKFISNEGYIQEEADKTEKVVKIPEGLRLGYSSPSSSRPPYVGGRDGYVFVSWVEQESKVEYTAEDMKNLEKTAALYDGKDKTFVAKWDVDYSFVEYIKEPTCTETGIALQKSNAPGSSATRQVPVPANGHTPVIDAGVAPTKTSVGWTTGSHCSVCGTVLKARTQIPMLKEDSSGKLEPQKGSGASGTGSTGSDAKPKYSSEWINGKWYNEDGTCTYKGELKWYSDSTGWWVEDTDGWYPQSQWQKIDGVWYYFNASGYMASGEWYNGYWFNSDGSWDSAYKMTWKNDATGWWIEDITGWWPSSSWQKIDGSWFYFEYTGYMAASKYVDGYWIGSDGVCQ